MITYLVQNILWTSLLESPCLTVTVTVMYSHNSNKYLSSNKMNHTYMDNLPAMKKMHLQMSSAA